MFFRLQEIWFTGTSGTCFGGEELRFYFCKILFQSTKLIPYHYSSYCIFDYSQRQLAFRSWSNTIPNTMAQDTMSWRPIFLALSKSFPFIRRILTESNSNPVSIFSCSIILNWFACLNRIIIDSDYSGTLILVWPTMARRTWTENNGF